MNVHINLLAVLLSAIASMVIGTIYYMDNAFGKYWKTANKITEKQFAKNMPTVMPLVFIAAFLTAYVVAYVTYIDHFFFQNSWLAAGLASSLILWLGLSATTLFIHDSLDQRPKTLTLTSIGNRLLSILAMGLIIGWLHP